MITPKRLTRPASRSRLHHSQWLRVLVNGRRSLHAGDTTADDSTHILSLTTPPGASGEPAREPLWPGRWATDRKARMLRYDLEPAGIPYVDEQGRQADFDALRHTFISMLAAAGIHPKTAQELARHSDINLTMQAYTHLRTTDLSAALDTLPSLAPNRETLKATGTTNAVATIDHRNNAQDAGSLVARMVTRAGDIPCNPLRLIATGTPTAHASEHASGDDAQADDVQSVEHDCDTLPTAATRVTRRVDNGTRTRDLRNHNPAL
jgi:hypothetical protein